MKKFTMFILALVLSACAQFGVPTPETLPSRIAVGIISVTEVRSQTLFLAQSGKLSKEDAENLQKQADNARAGLEVARLLAATDPVGADAKLQQTRAVLLALQQYLLAKEAKK